MTPEEYLALLESKKLTLGSAESLTGGLFASTITGVPGASKVFKGSLVTYAIETKAALLGIDLSTIKEHGVVSSVVAFQMASLARKKLNVDLAVSFTGNAGPDALDGLPVGTVFIGIATKSSTSVIPMRYHGSRNEIRKACVQTAIDESAKTIVSL